MSQYTAVIEYFDVPNACEVPAGQELVCVEADSKEGAREQVQALVESQGYSPGQDFHVLECAEGGFDDIDAFWDEIRALDEQAAVEGEREQREIEWEEYLQGAFAADEE